MYRLYPCMTRRAPAPARCPDDGSPTVRRAWASITLAIVLGLGLGISVAAAADRHATPRADATAETRASAPVDDADVAEPASGTSARCPDDCSGHGVCKSGRCFCEPGYGGDRCASVAGCPNDCSGHGLCQFDRCFCEPGYGGADCRTTCTPRTPCR
ncbi:MAG: hypothetical protein H6709_01975 [Kofleriaceae bacterium]|nr:hypothetical protein [Kofleriaceae bacterium]